jgi:uncharacterized membrane protein
MQSIRRPNRKRSVVKAMTYRLGILCLDFAAVYLFTGKVETAVGFMIVSNVYTTVGYFVHERIWARVRWELAPEGTGRDGHAPRAPHELLAGVRR